MTTRPIETFSLVGVQWPNAITEFWFKASIVEAVPKQNNDEVDGEQYKFVGHTQFASFESSVLELILQEKIAFSLQDLGEMLEAASNNPLTGWETPSLDVDLIEHLAQKIDVTFICSVIADAMRQIESKNVNP